MTGDFGAGRHGLGQHRKESFARYYLRQVALGEGCNCAEHVLGSRRSAAGRAPSARQAGGFGRSLWRLLGRMVRVRIERTP